jgi:hypothetical protein
MLPEVHMLTASILWSSTQSLALTVHPVLVYAEALAMRL